MFAPRPLAAALCLTVGGAAQALIVPMPGWVPVGGDATVWTDATGACLLREERHGQAMPQFDSPDKALTFAQKLQASLDKRVDGVVAQPVDRAGAWGVLAAYDLKDGANTFRVAQLYLSDAGLLRTITGSSGPGAGECTNAMRDFIRYMAN